MGGRLVRSVIAVYIYNCDRWYIFMSCTFYSTLRKKKSGICVKAFGVAVRSKRIWLRGVLGTFCGAL